MTKNKKTVPARAAKKGDKAGAKTAPKTDDSKKQKATVATPKATGKAKIAADKASASATTNDNEPSSKAATSPTIQSSPVKARINALTAKSPGTTASITPKTKPAKSSSSTSTKSSRAAAAEAPPLAPSLHAEDDTDSNTTDATPKAASKNVDFAAPPSSSSEKAKQQQSSQEDDEDDTNSQSSSRSNASSTATDSSGHSVHSVPKKTEPVKPKKIIKVIDGERYEMQRGLDAIDEASVETATLPMSEHTKKSLNESRGTLTSHAEESETTDDSASKATTASEAESSTTNTTSKQDDASSSNADTTSKSASTSVSASAATTTVTSKDAATKEREDDDEEEESSETSTSVSASKETSTSVSASRDTSESVSKETSASASKETPESASKDTSVSEEETEEKTDDKSSEESESSESKSASSQPVKSTKEEQDVEEGSRPVARATAAVDKQEVEQMADVGADREKTDEQETDARMNAPRAEAEQQSSAVPPITSDKLLSLSAHFHKNPVRFDKEAEDEVSEITYDPAIRASASVATRTEEPEPEQEPETLLGVAGTKPGADHDTAKEEEAEEKVLHTGPEVELERSPTEADDEKEGTGEKDDRGVHVDNEEDIGAGRATTQPAVTSLINAAEKVVDGDILGASSDLQDLGKTLSTKQASFDKEKKRGIFGFFGRHRSRSREHKEEKTLPEVAENAPDGAAKDEPINENMEKTQEKVSAKDGDEGAGLADHDQGDKVQGPSAEEETPNEFDDTAQSHPMETPQVQEETKTENANSKAETPIDNSRKVDALPSAERRSFGFFGRSRSKSREPKPDRKSLSHDSESSRQKRTVDTAQNAAEGSETEVKNEKIERAETDQPPALEGETQAKDEEVASDAIDNNVYPKPKSDYRPRGIFGRGRSKSREPKDGKETTASSVGSEPKPEKETTQLPMSFGEAIVEDSNVQRKGENDEDLKVFDSPVDNQSMAADERPLTGENDASKIERDPEQEKRKFSFFGRGRSRSREPDTEKVIRSHSKDSKSADGGHKAEVARPFGFFGRGRSREPRPERNTTGSLTPKDEAVEQTMDKSARVHSQPANNPEHLDEEVEAPATDVSKEQDDGEYVEPILDPLQPYSYDRAEEHDEQEGTDSSFDFNAADEEELPHPPPSGEQEEMEDSIRLEFDGNENPTAVGMEDSIQLGELAEQFDAPVLLPVITEGKDEENSVPESSEDKGETQSQAESTAADGDESGYNSAPEPTSGDGPPLERERKPNEEDEFFDAGIPLESGSSTKPDATPVMKDAEKESVAIASSESEPARPKRARLFGGFARRLGRSKSPTKSRAEGDAPEPEQVKQKKSRFFGVIPMRTRDKAQAREGTEGAADAEVNKSGILENEQSELVSAKAGIIEAQSKAFIRDVGEQTDRLTVPNLVEKNRSGANTTYTVTSVAVPERYQGFDKQTFPPSVEGSALEERVIDFKEQFMGSEKDLDDKPEADGDSDASSMNEDIDHAVAKSSPTALATTDHTMADEKDEDADLNENETSDLDQGDGHPVSIILSRIVEGDEETPEDDPKGDIDDDDKLMDGKLSAELHESLPDGSIDRQDAESLDDTVQAIASLPTEFSEPNDTIEDRTWLEGSKNSNESELEVGLSEEVQAEGPFREEPAQKDEEAFKEESAQTDEEAFREKSAQKDEIGLTDENSDRYAPAPVEEAEKSPIEFASSNTLGPSVPLKDTQTPDESNHETAESSGNELSIPEDSHSEGLPETNVEGPISDVIENSEEVEVVQDRHVPSKKPAVTRASSQREEKPSESLAAIMARRRELADSNREAINLEKKKEDLQKSEADKSGLFAKLAARRKMAESNQASGISDLEKKKEMLNKDDSSAISAEMQAILERRRRVSAADSAESQANGSKAKTAPEGPAGVPDWSKRDDLSKSASQSALSPEMQAILDRRRRMSAAEDGDAALATRPGAVGENQLSASIPEEADRQAFDDDENDVEDSSTMSPELQALMERRRKLALSGNTADSNKGSEADLNESQLSREAAEESTHVDIPDATETLDDALVDQELVESGNGNKDRPCAPNTTHNDIRIEAPEGDGIDDVMAIREPVHTYQVDVRTDDEVSPGDTDEITATGDEQRDETRSAEAHLLLVEDGSSHTGKAYGLAVSDSAERSATLHVDIPRGVEDKNVDLVDEPGLQGSFAVDEDDHANNFTEVVEQPTQSFEGKASCKLRASGLGRIHTYNDDKCIVETGEDKQHDVANDDNDIGQRAAEDHNRKVDNEEGVAVLDASYDQSAAKPQGFSSNVERMEVDLPPHPNGGLVAQKKKGDIHQAGNNWWWPFNRKKNEHKNSESIDLETGQGPLMQPMTDETIEKLIEERLQAHIRDLEARMEQKMIEERVKAHIRELEAELEKKMIDVQVKSHVKDLEARMEAELQRISNSKASDTSGFPGQNRNLETTDSAKEAGMERDRELVLAAEEVVLDKPSEKTSTADLFAPHDNTTADIVGSYERSDEAPAVETISSDSSETSREMHHQSMVTDKELADEKVLAPSFLAQENPVDRLHIQSEDSEIPTSDSGPLKDARDYDIEAQEQVPEEKLIINQKVEKPNDANLASVPQNPDPKSQLVYDPELGMDEDDVRRRRNLYPEAPKTEVSDKDVKFADENEEDGGGLCPCRRVILLCLLLLLIGIGVGVGISLAGNKPKSPPVIIPVTLPPTTSPTPRVPVLPGATPAPVGPTESTVAPTLSNQPLEQQTYSTICNAGLPDCSLLLDTKTPQGAAFQWLLADPSLAIYSSTDIIQRYALAAIYYATNGPSWSQQSGWLGSENVCNWYSSVSLPCDSNGNLITLALENNALKGTLPYDVNLLSNLNNMTLSNAGETFGTSPGALEGPFPNISALSLLASLDLSGNKLTGTMPSASLSSLTNLVQLNLKGNKLSGPIPPSISGLSSLLSLSLGENAFSGLSSNLFQLSQLNTLSMQNNSFGGEIPVGISGMSSLTSLDLSGNNIGGSIPGVLGQLVLLDFLDLSSNDLGGTIPTSLGSLTLMQQLFLNNNVLTGGVPSSFANMVNITTIHLENNRLTGIVPDSVCSLYSTTHPLSYIDCGQILAFCFSYCCTSGVCTCRLTDTTLCYKN